MVAIPNRLSGRACGGGGCAAEGVQHGMKVRAGEQQEHDRQGPGTQGEGKESRQGGRRKVVEAKMGEEIGVPPAFAK